MQRRKWKSTGWKLQVNGLNDYSKFAYRSWSIDYVFVVLLSCVSRDVKGVREDPAPIFKRGELN